MGPNFITNTVNQTLLIPTSILDWLPEGHLVRLLLYCYATSVDRSRKIETRTFEDLAFRYLFGDQHPDHTTIAEFRKRHLYALSGLFT
jgi:hypothetical protein